MSTSSPPPVFRPRYLSTDGIEIKPGSRIQLLGDEFVRDAGGEATVVAVTGMPGRYRLRLDNGLEKLLRLDCERFRLLRFGVQKILNATRFRGGTKKRRVSTTPT